MWECGASDSGPPPTMLIQRCLCVGADGRGTGGPFGSRSILRHSYRSRLSSPAFRKLGASIAGRRRHRPARYLTVYSRRPLIERTIFEFDKYFYDRRKYFERATVGKKKRRFVFYRPIVIYGVKDCTWLNEPESLFIERIAESAGPIDIRQVSSTLSLARHIY